MSLLKTYIPYKTGRFSKTKNFRLFSCFLKISLANACVPPAGNGHDSTPKADMDRPRP